MNLLYFQFLQTVAKFIVQATKIDSNKDGKISGSEITNFLGQVVLPLILNAGVLKNQWQAFFDFIKGISLEQFKKAIMDLVEQDLLPSELDVAEKKVDRIAESLLNTILAVEDNVEAFKEVFGGKVLAVQVMDKKEALKLKAEELDKSIKKYRRKK